MGPDSDTQVDLSDAPTDLQRSGADEPVRPDVDLPSRSPEHIADDAADTVASPWQVLVDAPDHNLLISTLLFRSRSGSLLWLIVRLWLGYEWLNAGYQKIWGSERSAFWFGGGTGVKGFASASILG